MILTFKGLRSVDIQLTFHECNLRLLSNARGSNISILYKTFKTNFVNGLNSKARSPP